MAKIKRYYNIAGAILVVGLAFISVIAYLKSNGVIGTGWGKLSCIILLFWDWSK